MFVIDIEASGLGDDSYPIEIAWGHRYDPTFYDTFLIRPARDWTHWDNHAELNIHGLSRETLYREGVSVQDAVARLEQHLRGKTVYSDHVASDRPWVVKLYSQLGREPSFEFRPVQSLVRPDKVSEFCLRYSSTPIRHRALADVRKIISTLNYFAPE